MKGTVKQKVTIGVYMTNYEIPKTRYCTIKFNLPKIFNHVASSYNNIFQFCRKPNVLYSILDKKTVI